MSEVDFAPPAFVPHRWMRGGHLQTLASLRRTDLVADADAAHRVDLPDGDAIVVHESGRDDADRSLVLFHGLSGCHRSPYMVRLATRFMDQGWKVYRVDMRGCGAARNLARQLSHAGRSDDVAAALEFVARHRAGDRLAAIGVSLGGNQLLRLAGRVGSGLDRRPEWFDRLARIAAVAPPIDLVRCSENMQRLSRRLYNYYFIRNLFDQVAPAIRQHEVFQQAAAQGRPRTLLELDHRVTAPLSGFDSALDYYRSCGAATVAAANPVPTLVLAARDDPIVPGDCFERGDWPSSTRVLLHPTGGHAGFVGRGQTRWMDDCLLAWMNLF